MDIRNYEYPLAVAKEGSLSKAAECLGISQSALSHSLAALEARLGKPIFDRSTHYLEPTAAGRVYLDLARQIVDIKRQTYQAIGMLSQPYTRTVSIGISPLNGAQFFAFLYKNFTCRYPNVLLTSKESYPSELKQKLLNGEIDLMLGSATDHDEPGCNFLRFARQEILATVSENHPLAAMASETDAPASSISLKDLEDIPFLLPAKEHAAARILDHAFSNRGISSTVLLRASNLFLLREMTLNGLGVGFLPAVHVYAKPGLRYFRLDPPVWTYSGIYYRRDLYLDPVLTALIGFCYRYTIIRTDNPFLTLEPGDSVKAILEQCEREHLWN